MSKEKSKQGGLSAIIVAVVAGLIVAGIVAGYQYIWVPRQESAWQKKIGGLLKMQINLKKDYIANPAPEKLEQMKRTGMETENLNMQRIFIHLIKEPAVTQVDELKAMGIISYPDSWIPPVGDHPTGFILADVPIDKLEDLTKKDYVVRIDTAERVFKPQAGSE